MRKYDVLCTCVGHNVRRKEEFFDITLKYFSVLVAHINKQNENYLGNTVSSNPLTSSHHSAHSGFSTTFPIT